jgi:hypothetical protein
MWIVPAKSPLGSWLVSALPIPFRREWYNSATDFNPNTNSSVLLECKQAPVHIKPTPHQAKPKQKYCMRNVLHTSICIVQYLSYIYLGGVEMER